LTFFFGALIDEGLLATSVVGVIAFRFAPEEIVSGLACNNAKRSTSQKLFPTL